MTNERMAELISEGGNDELLPLMWEKVRKLFRVMSEQYYRKHLERCQAAGVTAEDLQQESYFAMLEAIQSFSAREDKSLTFTAYCRFPFLKHAQQLTGARTARTRQDVLNISRLSFDEQQTNSEGEEAGSLGDCIPDENATRAFEAAENELYTEQVHTILENAIDTLPQREAAIVRASFWDGAGCGELAGAYKLSRQRISQLKREGLKRLRKIKEVKALTEIRRPRTVSAQEQLLHGSFVEQEAERRERLRAELLRELNLL